MKAERARLLVVAAAGIVIAHAADYALAFPDPVRRGHELAATGHGYWPLAVAVAVVCGAFALGLTIRSGWGGQRSTTRLPAAAVQVAAGQVVLFTAVETVERVAAGGHPIAFLTSVPFAVGIVLQVAVAVAAAVVLRGVEDAVHRIAAGRRRARPADDGAPAWPRPIDNVVVRWWGVAGDARGPPLTLPA